MNRLRIVLLIFSGAGIYTAFLPWQTTHILGEVTSIKGVDSGMLLQSMQIGDAWLCIVDLATIVIIAASGKIRLLPGRFKLITTIILAGFSVFVGAFHLSKANAANQLPADNPLAMTTQPGIGIYLLLAFCICIMLVSLVFVFTNANKPK